MVDIVGLIPLIFLLAVAGSILVVIQNKDQIYAELKKYLKKCWKNRNERDE